MPDDNDVGSIRRALNEFLNRLARAVSDELTRVTPSPDQPSVTPPIIRPPEGGGE